MLVELKNGETLTGHLVSCDTWMNLTLKEVVQTSPEGDKFHRLPEVYVRGNNVSYGHLSRANIRIPNLNPGFSLISSKYLSNIMALEGREKHTILHDEINEDVEFKMELSYRPTPFDTYLIPFHPSSFPLLT